jgi:hypothetical protein
VASGAVDTKAIAAYRYGLDVPQTRPSDLDVERAAELWLRDVTSSEKIRVEHPVLLRFLLWCGINVGKRPS